MNENEDWDGFVAAVAPQWALNAITKELLDLTGDEKMAMAIWACLRSQSLDWMHRQVPVLEGRRPVDLLNDEKGREELKWILISNPWW